MSFDITLVKAKAAFEFCYDKFLNTEPPNLKSGERGEWEADADGSGNWCREGNSYYFNCGATDPNLEDGEIPKNPEKGRLAAADMDNFEKWVAAKNLGKYNLLKDGSKYNFTAVVNHRAFNFHLVRG